MLCYLLLRHQRKFPVYFYGFTLNIASFVQENLLHLTKWVGKLRAQQNKYLYKQSLMQRLKENNQNCSVGMPYLLLQNIFSSERWHFLLCIGICAWSNSSDPLTKWFNLQKISDLGSWHACHRTFVCLFVAFQGKVLVGKCSV